MMFSSFSNKEVYTTKPRETLIFQRLSESYNWILLTNQVILTKIDDKKLFSYNFIIFISRRIIGCLHSTKTFYRLWTRYWGQNHCSFIKRRRQREIINLERAWNWFNRQQICVWKRRKSWENIYTWWDSRWKVTRFKRLKKFMLNSYKGCTEVYVRTIIGPSK